MGKNILVVDDSKTVRSALRIILENLGFTVTEAENGRDAERSCSSTMPLGIILDWNMPVMDGLEFLKKLRSSPAGKLPKVIFCSTENDLNSMKKAIQAGAQDFIIKPFNESVMKKKLIKVGLL